MLLKSLKLHNIRSYTDEQIEFPTGSVLLSGDIGSGKSSILLAIEFALFGVRKPDLTGAALLRKGENKGTIELRFKIGKKDIIIRRVLKKTRNDIKQDAGFIIINGIKTEATAVELKAKVLDLLGYPKDLLTKHKDIIYRYTVYTPQEEMKAILFEDRHLRLGTLRKVFGIDRYKTIRENCLIYLREIKNRNREYAGKIFDLTEKLGQLKTKVEESEAYEKKVIELEPKHEKAKLAVEQKRESIKVLEEQVEELNRHKKDLELLEKDLKNTLDQRKRNNQEINSLKNESDQIAMSVPKEKHDMDQLEAEMKKTETWIADTEKDIQDIQKDTRELEINISQSSDIIQKIIDLDTCPTCEQKVDGRYKQNIKDREDEKVRSAEQGLDSLKEQFSAATKILSKQKSQLMIYREKEKKLIRSDEKLKTLKRNEESIKRIQKQQEALKKEIGEINSKKITLNENISAHRELEESFRKARIELEPLEKDERVLDIELNSTRGKAEEAAKTIDIISKEIELKLEIKQRIKDNLALINWLEEYFINLMITMEKHVMSQLYREFNEYFIEWFHSLIEDEAISAKLNDEFSPVIQQNGYDTELEHLSGGEKTSVALAYRLALNKVINDFITHIKTRDLIILDEPTDGFSDQQLDRVRELLENLAIPQIIVVSHEAKIETFVDSVIRVSKTEHVSSIAKTI